MSKSTAELTPETAGYLDFELEATLGETACTVRVLHSQEGEPREVVPLPPAESLVADSFPALRPGAARGGRHAKAVHREGEPVDAEARARAQGDALFDLLFRGAVRDAYNASLGRATERGKKLCIRLRTDNALSSVPWELLTEPTTKGPMCLDPRLALFRYPAVGVAPKKLQVRRPLRVLFFSASPGDLPSLQLGLERQKLEAALDGPVKKGLVELHFVEGQSRDDLRRALAGRAFHGLHFSGHGDFDPEKGEGYLMFTGAAGRAERVYASDLARDLAVRGALRLVVLNACHGATTAAHDMFTSVGAKLETVGIPAVVAMQREISDEAAIRFSEAFYDGALGEKMLPIDEAVREGRIAIGHVDAEWATPVLYLRATDGRLFIVRDPVPLVVLVLAAAGIAAILAAVVYFLVKGPEEPVVPPPRPGAVLRLDRDARILVDGTERVTGRELALDCRGDGCCAGFTVCIEIAGGARFPVPTDCLYFGEPEPPPEARECTRLRTGAIGREALERATVWHIDAEKPGKYVEDATMRVHCEGEGAATCLVRAAK